MTRHGRLLTIASVAALAGLIQGCSTASASGTHTGMASNTGLQNRVAEAFNRDPRLAGSYIDVSADRGTVYLHGLLFSQVANAQAVQVASRVQGVERVVDDISVANEGN